MENKNKLLDVFRWIGLIPISILSSELISMFIEYLGNGLEWYIFGDNFFNYYWSMIGKAFYSAIFGSLLCIFSYHIAPNFKKKSTLILLFLTFLVEIILIRDFQNQYFYIKIITYLISGLITLNILDSTNLRSFKVDLFTLLGLIIISGFYISMLALHLWTVKMAYHEYGLFGGYGSFFLPFISEIVYLIKLWGDGSGYTKLFLIVIGMSIFQSFVSKILKS